MLHEWRILQKGKKSTIPHAAFIRRPRLYSYFGATWNFFLDHHARVAMNRHFYGPRTGYLSANWHRSSRAAASMELIYRRAWEARVVDDQLMLSFVATLSHHCGDVQALRDFMDNYPLRVCRHVVSKPPFFPDSSCDYIPELADGRPDRFVSCNQAVGSATVCLTDYSISICWQGAEKGWFIELVVYYQLGDCRSPHDWIWCVMGGDTCDKRPRASQPKEHPPGMIEHDGASQMAWCWSRKASGLEILHAVQRMYGVWLWLG